MSTARTDEFRKEAVRIALTSGLSRRQVADDLGVGFSTLKKWVGAHRGTDVVSAEDRDLARENGRLRREVRILKEEREILKKKPPSSSRAKSREVQVRGRTAWGLSD
jgi:transposase